MPVCVRAPHPPHHLDEKISAPKTRSIGRGDGVCAKDAWDNELRLAVYVHVIDAASREPISFKSLGVKGDARQRLRPLVAAALRDTQVVHIIGR